MRTQPAPAAPYGLASESGDPDLHSPGTSFESSPSPGQSRSPRIIAIGGGKGGVGKSLIASSFAILLSRRGYKVTAVDLDLGGANLHTTLGVDLPNRTLGDLLTGRLKHLSETAVQTGIQGLSLISGAGDAIGAADIPPAGLKLLSQQLPQLDSDIVILDLGAGTSVHTIDFFMNADVGILSLLPEPTSIENVYRFIRNVYYRRLWLSPALAQARPTIERAFDPKDSNSLRSPSDLYRRVSSDFPMLGPVMRREIEAFRFKLIVNQTRSQADIEIGESVRQVCRKYFGIEIDYLGHLDYDSAVWQAVRRKRAMVLEFPHSRLVGGFEKFVDRLLREPQT